MESSINFLSPNGIIPKSCRTKLIRVQTFCLLKTYCVSVCGKKKTVLDKTRNERQRKVYRWDSEKGSEELANTEISEEVYRSF